MKSAENKKGKKIREIFRQIDVCFKCLNSIRLNCAHAQSESLNWEIFSFFLLYSVVLLITYYFFFPALLPCKQIFSNLAAFIYFLLVLEVMNGWNQFSFLSFYCIPKYKKYSNSIVHKIFVIFLFGIYEKISLY